MRKKSRKLLVISLFAVFVVSAPSVLLFTMGYRYNWKKHKPEKTGILSVSSRPSGAAVWIDGADTGKDTPVSFARLLPEDYTVRIARDGYLPWKKTLTIRSGETTFAKTITLFRDALPGIVIDVATEDAVFSPDGSHVALLSVEDERMELRTVDLAEETVAVLARFPSDDFTDVRMTWSPDGAYVLMTGMHVDDGYTALAYDADGADMPRSLHDILPKPAWSMRWSGTGDQLIAGTGVGLYAFRLTDEKEPVLISPFAADAMAVDDDAVLLRRTSDGMVLQRGPLSSAAEREDVTKLPPGEYAVRAYVHPYVILAETRGDLWSVDVTDGTTRRMGRGGDVVWERGPSPHRALVCNDFEVAIMDLRSGDRELVTRLGTAIGACDWSPENDYVLYSSGGAIAGIELDPRGERNVVPLIGFSAISSFRADPRTGTLWFTGEIGNRHGLFEREL